MNEPTLHEQLAQAIAARAKAETDWVKANVEFVRIQELINEGESK